MIVPVVTVVVAVALLREDGFVLMQRRPEGKQHGGLWEFPGGKIEPGEGAADAARREMAEELGVMLEGAALMPVSFAESAAPDSAGVADSRRVLLLLYAARVWQGEPTGLEDQPFAWVAPQDLPALAMPPLDVPLVRDLLRWLDQGK